MSSRRSAGGRDKAASVFVQIAYHTTARLKLGTREHPRPALHSNCVLVSWQSPGKHLGGLGMISGRGVGANLRKWMARLGSSGSAARSITGANPDG